MALVALVAAALLATSCGSHDDPSAVADASAIDDDAVDADERGEAHVESTVCIDPSRVYAAGMSNGGAFASGLACDSARTFGAIASVSGLAPCRSGGPAVPVIAFHGTADPIYPYDGGPLGGASDASDRRPRGTPPPPELPPSVLPSRRCRHRRCRYWS